MDKITTDLMYPAIVAVLASYLSFIGSYKSSRAQQKEDKKTQTLTLVENFLMHFNKLVNAFDTLSADIESRNMYMLNNIDYGKKVAQILSGYLWNTYLLGNTQLRTQVVETIDNASALMNELDGLERYPLDELTKAESKRADINKEFRSLRKSLLAENIVIMGKPIAPKYVEDYKNKENNVQKIDATKELVDELDDELRKTNDNIAEINARNEKRRPLLAIKIVDQKTRVRDLIISLDRLKTELSN